VEVNPEAERREDHDEDWYDYPHAQASERAFAGRYRKEDRAVALLSLPRGERQFFADDSVGRQLNTQRLSDDELRFLTQIRRYSSNLNESDRKLLLAMVKKFAATATR
jgi:hypothetical protein